MTAVAVTVLAVWAVGIAGMVASFRSVLRDNPLVQHAFDFQPATACLLTAIAIAFWPGALAAAGLNHLAAQWRKP